MIRKHFNVFPFTQWTALLGVFALLTLLPLAAGCGGNNEDVATDPADGAGMDEMPAETLPDPSFDGEGTGQGDVDSADLDPEPTTVELEDVFFDYDKFDLDATDRAVLNRNGEMLQDTQGVDLLIEGHCDERGTVQYNLALGEKRAKQARDYLVSLGVPASRIEVVSYGKERPFAEGSGEQAWSKNRRAHFVVR